jgi:hypothetical protein
MGRRRLDKLVYVELWKRKLVGGRAPGVDNDGSSRYRVHLHHHPPLASRSCYPHALCTHTTTTTPMHDPTTTTTTTTAMSRDSDWEDEASGQDDDGATAWGVEALPGETADAALSRAVCSFDVDAFLDPSSGTKRSSKVVKKVSDCDLSLYLNNVLTHTHTHTH